MVASAVVLAAGAYFVVTLMQPSAPKPDATPTGPRASEEAREAPSSSPAAPPAEPGRRSARRESPPPAPAPETVAVEAAPEVGTLRIETDVPGAQVFIDRQFVGMAPVTAENLKPGTHQLNVSAEGFEGIARAIDVEPGPRDLMLRFREVRLDVRIAVVHKHRTGSCRGQLVASAQGLRYETADADDRFNAALADLEAFQVDYQDKNLRIKLRKGKQYNFTDPDGIADRLFVFHRDVDKARLRLAGGERPATD